MVRRYAVPARRFGFIFVHASALGIHYAEPVLGFGNMFGCFAVPAHRFGFIFVHASAVGIHYAEIELGRGVSLFGR